MARPLLVPIAFATLLPACVGAVPVASSGGSDCVGPPPAASAEPTAVIAIEAQGRSGNARSPSYDRGSFGTKATRPVVIAGPLVIDGSAPTASSGTTVVRALAPRGRSGNTRAPAYDAGNYPTACPAGPTAPETTAPATTTTPPEPTVASASASATP